MSAKRKKAYTSIKVDPELWKEAKIEAIRREIDVSTLLESCLRKELGMTERDKK
jgi:post-segregation antitoxin (ccd killing protein)